MMQVAGAVSHPRTVLALVAEEAAMKKRREMVPELPGVTRMHPRWEGILRGDHPLAGAQRLYRRFFSLFPSPWRCKFCNAPFRGDQVEAIFVPGLATAEYRRGAVRAARALLEALGYGSPEGSWVQVGI